MNRLIFQEKNLRENRFDPSSSGNSMNLSREDYRKHIIAAYQEGMNDARKEKEKTGNAKNSVKTEGDTEAAKVIEKGQEENRQRVKKILERKDVEMLRTETVFPFSFFPDTLLIDTTKITISKKQLFATENITTIPLKDLSDVNVQTYLFLSTLVIKYMPQASSPGMNQPVSIQIPNLKREYAIKAKNLLKGALVAKAEEIDIAKLQPLEVKQVLQKLGASEGIT
jgi:hypothetical protein